MHPSSSAPPTDSSAPDNRGPARILFADPDEEFHAYIMQDRKAAIVHPLLVKAGNEAMEILGNHDIELCAIYISQHVTQPDAYSVIRMACQLRPKTPVFLTYTDATPPIGKEALSKLGQVEAVERKFTFTEIAQKYYEPSILFEVSDALKQANLDPTPQGHEQEASDDDFMPIRTDSFMSGSVSLFDVYVRLHAGKYLKILKANDDFSTDRLESYLKKGVVNFYIHRVSQEAYLAYSQKLGAAVVRHPNISTDIKLAQTYSHGENIMGYLRQKDMIETSQLAFAESYVNMVYSLVYEMGLDQHEGLVTGLLGNPTMRDHSAGTTILGGIIARNLEFETKKSVVTIGMACLLHDIGIFNDNEGLELLDESEMTEEQRTMYLEHPMRGAKMLDEIAGLNPVIPQIVANHHRRRNGTGFPSSSGIAVTKVSVPMEIVGMADELLRLFLRKPQAPRKEIVDFLTHNIFPAFSPEVVEAAKKALQLEG